MNNRESEPINNGAGIEEATRLLDEARNVLPLCRMLLLTSLAGIKNSSADRDLKHFGDVWKTAVILEMQITEEKIVPAKKALGIKITNIEQEESVINDMEEAARLLGFDERAGTVIAEKHIRFTKKIQTRLGLSD